MKRINRAVLILLIFLLPASGCAKPTPKPTPDPDAALLAGQWEQFIPIESMPQQITLDPSGSAVVGDETGRWRLEAGQVYIRHSGTEDRYSYTVSGYMLTLFDVSSNTSEFYINPDAFYSDGAKNAELNGQWAAWSTFSMMNFDGDTELDNIVYTTAGRTVLQQKYAARDGILQTVDASGNYTYNLYSFSQEGALLLAETSDYDNQDKQWTPYWKKAAPDASLLASWTLAFDTSPGDTGLPSAIKLSNGDEGSAARQGKAETPVKWEYYNGGFIIIEYSETDLQYAWCTPQGSVLGLGNPDVDEAWYFDAGRFKPSAVPLAAISGLWKQEDAQTSLNFNEKGGAVAVTNNAGKTTTLSAAALDGLLKLTLGGKTYYMAYSVSGDTMQIYYGDFPFLDQAEMPVTLMKS
jgi:hypothetical protein